MKYFKKKISDLNCLKDEKHELAMLVQKLINIRVKSNGSCTSDRVSELMETIQTIS